MKQKVRFCIFVGFCVVCFAGLNTVFAYPEFIGYGYNSCLTCHYNAAGGGPLSDYGRALWSGEIAAHPFWSQKSDDELAEKTSAFFPPDNGGVTWLKPYIKYRGLMFQTNAGTSDAQTKFVNMQADVGASIEIDANGKWLVSGGIGYVPTPQGASPHHPEESSNWISREYYIRRKINGSWWAYLGFLDKVFGYRTPDHTAFSRSITETAENDQTHSLILYHTSEKADFFLQIGAGNLEQRADLREPGGGLWYERSLTDTWRGGASVYYSSDSYAGRTRLALLSRFKVGQGHSVLAEAGAMKTQPFDGEDVQNSGYGLLEGTMLLKRGFFLQSQAEYAKLKMQGGQPENLKWTLGLLIFPFQRAEIRAGYVLSRILMPTRYTDDSKTLELQLHLSL